MSKTKKVNKEKAHYRVMAVFSFFMTFFSFLLICAGVVQLTVLNPQFFSSVVKSSGYLQACQQELEEIFASYGTASNFDAEVFAPFATQDRIEKAIQQNIEYLYGKADVPNYDQYEQDLKEHLLKNVQERGIEVSIGIQTGVEDLAASCRTEFRNHTTIPFLEFAIRGVELAKKPLMLVLFVLGIIMLLILIFMWLISRKTVRFFPYVADSCFALAILSCVFPIIGLSQKIFERFNISPESVRLLILGYANGIMKSFFPAGIVALFIGVGLVVLVKIKKKKQSQQIEQE